MLLYVVLSLIHWALLLMSSSTTSLTIDMPNVLSSSSAAIAIDPPLSPLRVAVGHDIETVAGYISGEYTCTYSQSNGTLYAGSTALYFLGSFFLFDKKLRLPWQDVLQVQKMDDNQGLQVLTKDDTVYVFTGIHAPDRAWVVLVSLHNDALMDRPPSARQQSPHAYREYKRRNSDPLLMSKSDLDFYELDNDDDNDAAAVPENNGFLMPTSKEGKETAKDDGFKTPAPKSKVTLPTPPPSKSFAASFGGGLDLQEVEYFIGKLSLQPIHCTHKSVAGKLYAGTDAVYFFGRKFFWDKTTVHLKWDAVRQVQVMERDDGIRILSKRDEAFEFAEMETPDKVWASLISLHNAELSSQQKRRQSSTRRRPTFRRMNSDPMMGSMFHVGSNNEEADTSTEVTTVDTSGGEASSQHGSQRSAIVNSLEEEWSKVKQTSDYDKKVVEDHVLQCNLDTYIDMFLENGAKYSIAAFLQQRGDSNLDASNWKDQDDEKHSRVIQYTHPVNAPLAPPEAGARKEQIYRRYGDHGISIETKTHVEGVPMADCFYVADRILVERIGDDCVSVTMEFKITFVKSTMFKSIIGRTTASEFIDLFKSMASYMSQGLDNGTATGTGTNTVQQSVAVPVKEQVKTPANPIALVSSSTMAVTLIVLVLLLQIWIIVEVRGIKATIRVLQETLHKGIE